MKNDFIQKKFLLLFGFNSAISLIWNEKKEYFLNGMIFFNILLQNELKIQKNQDFQISKKSI